MRVTITGAGGFIGSYLARELTRRGDSIQSWTRATADMSDARAVAVALAEFAPDVLVHLAAQSLPMQSWQTPEETYRVNVGGTINLLEAARALTRPPRLLLAGSSAEYAEPSDARPIAEDAPLAPNSPYAGSKLAVSELGRMYGQRYDLDIVRFRPFFFIGPGKVGDVCSDFAQRVVAVERGVETTMRIGDVSGVRDMIDVRDGVAGLVCLIDAGAAGEIYNVCSGRGVRIGDVLATYRRLARAPIPVVEDAALLRPLEHRVKIGDATKLRGLGWSPVHDLDDTLGAILDYARAQ